MQDRSTVCSYHGLFETINLACVAVLSRPSHRTHGNTVGCDLVARHEVVHELDRSEIDSYS